VANWSSHLCTSPWAKKGQNNPAYQMKNTLKKLHVTVKGQKKSVYFMKGKIRKHVNHLKGKKKN
jgi:hypothetical protein